MFVLPKLGSLDLRQDIRSLKIGEDMAIFKNLKFFSNWESHLLYTSYRQIFH